MFGKKVKSPKMCGLQRIDFRTEQRTVKSTQAVPRKETRAYKNTLNENSGRFDRYTYAVYGGEWVEQVVESQTTDVIGSFVCRRMELEGLNTPAVRMESQERVTNYLYDTVAKLGWCATCPMAGMTAIEADQYITTAKTAEAARIRADIGLQQAQADLEEFLQSRGANTPD